MTKQLKHAAKAGFTLVELAIVLVIIGLIVGGVLVGQDLIKAAEIRSTMSDIESYNAAATTFRNKYNGLPGDLLSTKASQFGLIARAGTSGQGDGNSLIEGCTSGAPALGCETALFWTDLTNAQLIADSYTTATNALVDASGAAVSGFLPATALREVSYVHVFPNRGRNYFYIGNLTATAGVVANVTAPAGLSTTEAAQIDEKADDGLPLSGIVRSVSTFDVNGPVSGGGAAAGSGVCVANNITTEAVYNVSDEEFANELNCNIFYRASF